MLLDTGASINVYTSERGLVNVAHGEEIQNQGIHRRPIFCDLVGTHPIWGLGYIVPQAPTTILSLHLSPRRYVFTKDEDGLYVLHCDGNSNSNGKYPVLFSTSTAPQLPTCYLSSATAVPRAHADLPVAHSSSGTLAVQEIDGKFYTPQQIQRAKEYGQLHAKLSHISNKDAKDMLDNGHLPDCHLTSRDVDNWAAMFSCEGCMAGKTTRHSVQSRPEEPVDLAHTLCADIVTIDSKQYLCSAEYSTAYLMALDLKSKGKLELQRMFSKILSFYRSHGHSIKRVSADDENNFESIREWLGQRGIQLKQSAAA